MFSGIIEATSPISRIEKNGSVYQIYLQKPANFDDLKIGDSIATNGVCLTVEEFDATAIRFSLGPETLRITGWDKKLQVGTTLNLERSLRLGDRIHGHMVTGHVDAVARVHEIRDTQESLFFSLEVPQEFKKFVWPKGSLCVSGVSLTINEVQKNPLVLSFYLIPETLKRTNLKDIKVNDSLNIEFDSMAKAVVNVAEARYEFNS
jgi:riboflavin synthase